MTSIDLDDPRACPYCGAPETGAHACDPEAMRALIKALRDRWASAQDVALNLVGRLDVMLPKIRGVVGLQSLRVGAPAYDGPDPAPWIEKLRARLGLADEPRMTERDFWPADYCRTCDGSGMVLPGEGVLPMEASLSLCVRSVRDRASAYRLMRGLDPGLKAVRARDLLDAMEDGTPLPVIRAGQTWHEAREVSAWREIGAEFVHRRQIVWPCYDICPECHGTANRGLPEGTPFQFNNLWPEAPVELVMHERVTDGSVQEMTREELERLFRVFSRGESSDGQVSV